MLCRLRSGPRFTRSQDEIRSPAMSNEQAVPKAEDTTPVRVAGLMESLPGIVKQRVTVLQDLQKQHDELEKKFREERSALIAKYQQLYEPLYSKRSDIVNGAEGTANEANEADGTPDTKEAPRGVPDFWLNAMKSNEILAMQITPKDEDALKYLKDIRSVYTNEPKGFKLEFYFAENPYFTNSLLVKEYHMVDEDEPILERAVGTEINWKPGKNLTMKLMKKRPKKGAPKDAPPQTKLQACESFFNFFSPPRIPDDGEVMDQDEAEELEDVMEQDYDVGATIRDKIIAHAVSWYTGEAAEVEDEDETVDLLLEESDEEEEDEEEEDDEDEDEEEDEEEPKAEGAPKQ